MKKIFALMLTAIMSIVMCTACGNKSGDSDTIKLSVGGWPTAEGDWLDTLNQRKADFEAEHQNVTIEPDTWTFDLKTFYPKAEAGLLPNIYDAHFTEFSKLYSGGYVADLTKALKDEGYYDNFNKKIIDLFTVDNKIYGFPTNAYVLGVNINAKLFREAGLIEEDGSPKQPKTWEELAEMATVIKEKTGKPGFALCTSNNCGGWFFTNIAWSYGVEFMKQDKDGKWIATFDTPEAVETLQYIKDLRWKYNCVPVNTNIDQTESRKLLATGQTAMILDGPLTDIGKYDMDLMDYGIMALPAGPKRHVALIGGTVTCLSNKSNEAQVSTAIKWLKFIGNTYEITDDSKIKTEENYKKQVNDNAPIGIKKLSPYSKQSDLISFRDQMIDKYCNLNPKNVASYNAVIDDEKVEFQAEEPVCAQDLYGILDGIIQEVYTNQDADCTELISKANSNFQKNFLDKLDY
jgi:ABC-type glycerol-3-phosphate transport system substrate-binding protein